MPVGGIDGGGGAHDEEQHDGDLNEHAQVIEIGGSLYPNHKKGGNEEDNDARGRVKNRRGVRERRRVSPKRFNLLPQSSAKGSPTAPKLQRRGERRWNVDQLRASGGRELRRHDDAHIVQKRNDVSRPANCDRDRADGVFENEVPPNNPREQLAQRGVTISIGAARHWNQRSKFTVTERGKNRGNPRQHE